jgi:hypothetical protein
MKNYFEKDEEENFESMDSKFHSHWEYGFKNPKISGSQRVEVKNWRNQRFQEVELKSKIQEVED